MLKVPPRLTRSPLFWTAHTLFFLLCLFYTWKNFYRAFPFVELEVKMDRKGAILTADELAARRGWVPKDHQHAVSFDIDSSTQNYIELEAGGPPALTKVLKEGIYNPYSWHVRLFAEGKTNETHVRFTPDGKPYGFVEKISEDDPGAALTTEQARVLAEKAAINEWAVDLASYHLVENSHEVRRSKRVDHSFIYEREKERIGEGRYRLKLVVSGDRLSEASPYIKVPEAFFRRYSSMRSANGTISSMAMAAIALLYGVFGCGFGLFLLTRRHWVLWKMPVLVGGVIAGLHFLEELNKLPLEWMSYDTAISSQAFLLQQFSGALIGSLFEFVILALPIMAAESLTRLAFPQQPQFWKVFSKDAAASPAIFGRVLGAYLMVGFHFAFVIWIYQFGSKRLGWWNPSELLFHPDALATYFPWLTSISNSLHAGVWEECLFRAIPLAGAALLGNRYGHRGKWILGAFLLQALIFGAGHASYPTQPSYARVIELIVPSFTFGGAYLLFGLLPGIIMHYIYDVALFAMPLFLSSGKTALVSRTIVVGVSLIPLGIVLAARLRQGAWRELPESLYNRAWRPQLSGPVLVAQASRPAAPGPVLSPRACQAILAGGVVALAVWAGLAQFKADAPGLKIGREEAVLVAKKALAERGVKLGPDWLALPTAEGQADEEDRFVWRTSGQEIYHKLIGNYLEPTLWRVRFARFEGDLTERAEEYHVYLAGAGDVERIRHELPEARAGATLDEAKARVIAENVVRTRYGLEPAKLKEISSQQFKLPSRSDWLFMWSDPVHNPKEGETRIGVRIAGDEVGGYRRYIDVPEKWRREERSRRTVMGLIGSIASTLLVLLALTLTFLAVRGWIHHEFSLRAFGITFGLLVTLGVLTHWNEFPVARAGFSTAQPWSSQLARLLIRDGLMTLMTAIVPAIWVGHLQSRLGGRSSFDAGSKIEGNISPYLGYAAGALLAATQAALAWAGRGTSPRWPSVGMAGTSFPIWGGMQVLETYLSGAAFLGLLMLWLMPRRRASSYWLLLVGFAAAAAAANESVLTWLGAGVAITLGLVAILALVRRTGPAILIPLVAVPMLLTQVRSMVLQAFPGALAEGLLGAVVLAVASWHWYSHTQSKLKSG
jgi:hypothetical protein